MSAGKTTVGKRLAQQLAWQTIDTDQFIENRYRKKINELFAEKGETEFREIERKILQEVAAFDDVVIATGGGTPCFFDNMALMNDAGKTVYLQVSVEELAKRLNVCKNSRPLVKDKNRTEMEVFVRENLAKREPFYRQAQVIFPLEDLFLSGNSEEKIEELIHSLNPRI